jgi:hypothetical protein
MSKSSKERPGDVLRRFALERQTEPEKYPDAFPAMDALFKAANRLSRATNNQVTVAMLRDMADAMEGVLAEFDKRPPHRPKGAAQYDLDELRREMERLEHQSVPPGSRFRKRNPWLANELDKRFPGKFGQDERAVLASIYRMEAKIVAEKQALCEVMKDDGPFTAESLEQFLTGGKSRGAS